MIKLIKTKTGFRTVNLRAPDIAARMMGRANVGIPLLPGEREAFRKEYVDAMIADNEAINPAND